MTSLLPAARRLMLLSLLVGSSALHVDSLAAALRPAARAPPPAALLSAPADEPPMRIGHGYDIHRMDTREAAGQPVVISGVKFDGSDAPDFELGCVAHSDGDVVYHSVVDAILGALTLPDIGCLFPDNDPRLRGADSSIFMEEAYSRMTQRGYRLGNVDVTLIAQKPRRKILSRGKNLVLLTMTYAPRRYRSRTRA